MGLDHWMSKVKKEDTFTTVLSGRYPKKNAEWEDIITWRKDYGIHDWFYSLYKSKGGKLASEDFNCIPVEVTAEDLDEFKADLKNDNSDIYANSMYSEYDGTLKSNSLAAVESAKQAIEEGYVIFYNSWW